MTTLFPYTKRNWSLKLKVWRPKQPHIPTDREAMAAVIVHGGAYAIPDSIAEDCKVGCAAAANSAYEALLAGKSAVDCGEFNY